METNTLRIPADYVLLEVEKEHEDTIRLGGPGAGGLTLAVDTTYHPNRHKRIFGTVLAPPGKLSRRSIGLPRTNPGRPEPRTHVPADAVAHHARRGLRGGSLPRYNCSTYTPEYYTLADYVLDVRAGDRVYFHFNALEEENRLWQYFPGKRVYQVRYDQCICVVRPGGEIIPVASKALVVPVMQSWEDISVPVTLPDGRTERLLFESEVKPKYLEGVVTHIGAGLGGEELGVKPGDRILYQPDADFTNTIEGEEYYVISQEDILCVVG